MVLVNNPGSWDAIYQSARTCRMERLDTDRSCISVLSIHSRRRDHFSLGKRVAAMRTQTRSISKDISPSLLIFVIGLILNTFPFYDFAKGEWLDVGMIRIMGVLQRIAICYLVASLLFLHASGGNSSLSHRTFIIYWFLMTCIDVPGCLRHL